MENLQFIGNIQPEDFKVIGFCYLEPIGEDDMTGKMEFELEYDVWDDTDAISKELEQEIVRMACDKNGRCNHCNIKIAYIYIVKNMIHSTIHTFGSTCGVDVQNFRGSIAADAQKENMKKRKAIKREGIRSEILASNPGLAEALLIDNKIIGNIAEKFRTYDKISDKQIELVFKIKLQNELYNAAKVNFGDVPVGKVCKIELTVCSIKEVTEPGFNRNDPEKHFYAMVLQDATGWKIWGKINRDNFSAKPLIGDKVLIGSMQVSQSPKDSKFGFFKNERNVIVNPNALPV